MNRKIIFIGTVVIMLFVWGCSHPKNTQFVPAKLGKEEIEFLKEDLAKKEEYYDQDKKMLWTMTRDKHYHSDLDSGIIVHQTRESLEYAVALMYTNEPEKIERGIDIVETVLPMQEKDPEMPFCGIWPYYPEDPLRGRKAPVDYNWADFIAVPLIDVMMHFSEHINDQMKKDIKEALILSARSIMKRNVQGDYTNICIMGTYVCYVVGDLYDLPEINDYARNKLAYFYQYTKDNKGFTEYNSPTYTVVAMNELLRMQRTIIHPEDKEKVDELYTMCWDMIARHFHQPSGQWCGPYLRTYSNLLTPELKRLLFNASGGVIDFPGDFPRIPNVITPHRIPEKMISMFADQALPRIEVDTFVVGNMQKKNEAFDEKKNKAIVAKDIIGKLYAHPQFALASVNQGYLWNQCRPLIAHWGTQENPVYMQIRFLHDHYDFSAVNMVSVQDSSTVLSVLNIANNGGDKHPNIDRIRESTIEASDLRLRFEIGGDISGTEISIDKKQNLAVLKSGHVNSLIHIPYTEWDGLTVYWSLGGDEDKKWIDYIIYSGNVRKFDFDGMTSAVLGLQLSMYMTGDNIPSINTIQIHQDGEYLTISNGRMGVKALKKAADEFLIKNDYEITH